MENRTKAGHGFRSIDLTTLAKELIQVAKSHQQKLGLDDKGYIFMTGKNFQSFYGRMRKTFPSLCKSAGIPKNTPYSGRRTFISSLLDEGVNIRTVKNYVGHKDSRTTYRHYCYDRAEKEKRVEKLEKARTIVSFNEMIGGNLVEAVPTVPKS